MHYQDSPSDISVPQTRSSKLSDGLRLLRIPLVNKPSGVDHHCVKGRDPDRSLGTSTGQTACLGTRRDARMAVRCNHR